MKNYNDKFVYYNISGSIAVYDSNIRDFLCKIQKALSIYHDGLLDEEMLEACIDKSVSETINNIEKDVNSK